MNAEPKFLTLKQAAHIAGVSPDTVARWCKRYSIGRQLHAKAPWRVDPDGLAIVVSGNAAALAIYLEGLAGSNVAKASLRTEL